MQTAIGAFLVEPQRRAVAQLAARVEARVEQCRGMTLPSAFSIDCLTPGVLALEIDDQPLDALALQAEVAARRTAAADDRQPDFLAVQPRLVLADVDQRPDDDVLAVVGDEPRRHRLERAGEEQVQQQRLDEVVEVMAERDLRGADLGGDAVQDAAAQPRAQRARRGVGLEDVVHDLADRRVLDAVLPAALLAGLRDRRRA